MTTPTTPPKSSITQPLRTDLGRSVGVTTVTQLVNGYLQTQGTTNDSRKFYISALDTNSKFSFHNHRYPFAHHFLFNIASFDVNYSKYERNMGLAHKTRPSLELWFISVQFNNTAKVVHLLALCLCNIRYVCLSPERSESVSLLEEMHIWLHYQIWKMTHMSDNIFVNFVFWLRRD